MDWVLLAPNGEVIASGSWQAVVEAGEEDGVIQRRPSMCDGSETAPKIRPGYLMAPRGMFPEAEECVRYG
ncbi:hypothetical protein JRF84_08160 [Methylobacterium organophilum]|uniref:hypothetical protein n=1 Tax=Methylobacterium TaxID=407 RepID=UPI0019D183C8|nr:hypothetical protein [Methylobacterium organophilum]MBN6819562.1 hypothetical protein [Methylobacterium organophilum]